MFLVTNLISELASTLQILPRWNLLPLSYPYYLKKRGRYGNPATNYKFQANKKFYEHDWKVHILVFGVGSLFGLVRIKLDSHSVFERSVNVFICLANILIAFTVAFHGLHAESFSNFLNQLQKFEADHIASGKDDYIGTKMFWLTHSSCRLVCIVCKVFRVGHILDSVLLSMSSAAFPTVAWNLIPSIVYIFTPGHFQVGGNFSVDEIIRRIFILIYHYSAWRTLCNFASINIIINLLISTFGLNCCLITFQQKLANLADKTTQKSSFELSLAEVIQVYREVQILCTEYNNLHKVLIVSVYIIFGISCFCCSLHGLIANFRELDVTSGIILSSAVVWGAVLLLFCFHFPVKVFTRSRKVLANCNASVMNMHINSCRNVMKGLSNNRHNYWTQTRGNKHHQRNKLSLLLFRKYCLSFEKLKIFFFWGNYFDRLTPLVFFKFAIRMAINLTLIEK